MIDALWAGSSLFMRFEKVCCSFEISAINIYVDLNLIEPRRLDEERRHPVLMSSSINSFKKELDYFIIHSKKTHLIVCIL